MQTHSRKRLVPWIEEEAYEQRDIILAGLGFKSYDEYLCSEVWKQIRDSYLGKFRSCFCCGEFANQIHHRFYSEGNLTGRDQHGLFSICAQCHRQVEFKPSGQKASLGEANYWVFKLREKNFGGTRLGKKRKKMPVKESRAKGPQVDQRTVCAIAAAILEEKMEQRAALRRSQEAVPQGE